MKVTNEDIIEYGIRLLYAMAGIFISTIVFAVVSTWYVRGVYDDFRHAKGERELIQQYFELKIETLQGEIDEVDHRVTKTTGRNQGRIEQLEIK